jgi:hypothetical protein
MIGTWLPRGDSVEDEAGHDVATHAHRKVIWLTGVDYFSSLVMQFRGRTVWKIDDHT